MKGSNTAATFYEGLVSLSNFGDRATRDHVVIADIEKTETLDSIVSIVEKIRPKSILVVASEVIEHLKSPDQTWALIEHLEGMAVEGRGRSYVTIPIGSSIPSHHSEFLTADTARQYLQRHMRIENERLLLPPPELARPYRLGCICATGWTSTQR